MSTPVGPLVNVEGQVITAEQMAQIEQRHTQKAALVAEARADREAAMSIKHSHVGVELARDLGDYALIANTYHNLAAMANYCAIAGKDSAGRTLASLANGIMRGAVQTYGPSIEQRIYDYQSIMAEKARQDLGLASKPAEPAEDDERLAPLGFVDNRTQEQLEADGDTHWPDGTPYVPQPDPLLAGVVSQQLGERTEPMPAAVPEAEQTDEYRAARALYEQGVGNNPDYFISDDAPGQSASEDEVAAAVRGDLTPTPLLDDEDEPEPGMAMREAVSPEPDETPQRKAARQRREARRAKLKAQGQE